MAVYESMKESGIEWIGKIPATWKTHTLYQLVTQVKNKNSDLSEQNLLSLSYGKIKRKDINSNGGRNLSMATISLKMVILFYD